MYRHDYTFDNVSLHIEMCSPDRTPTRAGDHASSAVRRERSIPEPVGAFGSTPSDSELLFLEGHLPTAPGDPLEGAGVQLDAIATRS